MMPTVDAGGTGGSDGPAGTGDGPVVDVAADQGADVPFVPDAFPDMAVDAGTDGNLGTSPAIVSFTASPATIFLGQTSTLSWTVTGAATLTIDQGVGSVLVTVLGGTTQVVTPAHTTTYTLTLNNSLSAQVTVTVVSGATFSGGQAQGEMTGYGWVAMGTMGDAVTDPVCGTTQPYQPITAASPCTTQTDWSSPTALCMTGTIAALPAAPTQTDYSNNWGIEVGANANTDPTIAIGRSYASISVSITGSPTRATTRTLSSTRSNSDA